MTSKTRVLATARLLAACLLVAILHNRAACAFQEPEVLVEVDRDALFLGESILYRVTLNHVEDPAAPQINETEQFDVAPAGQQSLNSRQVTIINGRRSEVVRQGMQYNYRLTPRVAGQVTVPGPVASVNGQQYSGAPVTLTVIPPEDQDDVIVAADVDRETVFPMQPFELRLTISVRALPGVFSTRNPLSVQPSPPQLTVAWLDDDQIPEGITPESDWQQVLQPILSRSGAGLQINRIGSSSVFSLFGSRSTAFLPKSEQVTRPGLDGSEESFWQYTLRRRFVPRRVGTYSFPPITLKGTFATEVENGQLVGRSIYTLSDPVEVVVRDVPQEGRPESFIGAVGNFDVAAVMAPASAQVGDPMTLTVTISGEGALDDATPPDIAALPGVKDRFRAYDATQETLTGARRFTWSLRPLTAEITEFPAVPVAFFDVEQESYRTVETDPIPLTIREAETVSGGDIVRSAADDSPTDPAREVSEGGIFANDSASQSLTDESIEISQWVSAWVGLIAVYVATTFVVVRVRSTRNDPALQRRRSALSRARTRVRQVRESSEPSGASAAESLQRAVSELIADYANVPADAMTPREAAAHLESLRINRSLCDETAAFLERCDSQRYGASVETREALPGEATELVERLGDELPTSASPLPLKDVAAVSALLACLFAAGCGQTPDVDLLRQFDSCEQSFAAARDPDDFRRVAMQYQNLIDEGIESGSIYYNQGNAWMRAAEPARAIASYRMAHRFRPRDPYLTSNLATALRECGAGAGVTAEPGMAGYLFFWQDVTSYREKLQLTTACLSIVLALALLGTLLQRTPWTRRSLLAGFPLVILFATSAGWDWYRFERTVHGVIVEPDTVARKGNSDTYAPAFTQPLQAGTEFTVRETRDDWILAEISEGQTGWLPQKHVVTW